MDMFFLPFQSTYAKARSGTVSVIPPDAALPLPAPKKETVSREILRGGLLRPSASDHTIFSGRIKARAVLCLSPADSGPLNVQRGRLTVRL